MLKFPKLLSFIQLQFRKIKIEFQEIQFCNLQQNKFNVLGNRNFMQLHVTEHLLQYRNVQFSKF